MAKEHRGGAKQPPTPMNMQMELVGKKKLQEAKEIVDLAEVERDTETAMVGVIMPEPSEYLSAPQKDGNELYAKEIYKKTYNWLREQGCETLVSPTLIEQYAMMSARWIQCETITSQLGFLAKHPVTGAAVESPYVAIADKYMTQANKLWDEIYKIVQNDDPMAKAQRARKERKA